MAQPQDSQRDAPVYNIKAVTHLTGVPEYTLRRWEERYKVISPQRTEGGFRLYSQRDVDTVKWLKSKLEEGLSISRACELLHQAGTGLSAQPVPAPYPASSSPSVAQSPAKSFDLISGELLAAFERVDEERASAAVTEAFSLYSVEDVLLRIFQPALVEVGDAWARNEISVAAEHFASAFVRNRVSNLFHSSPHSANGPLALVACAPEELHELGAMFLSVFMRRGGYRVVYLGQNVPLDSLERMVEAISPDVLCVSATRTESAARLHSLTRSLDRLKVAGGRAPLLAYGGQIFNRFPHIGEQLGGINLGENAATAVQRLDKLLSA